jgi:putative endonuclease
MAYFKKDTGNLGEKLARRLLVKSGYKIIATNYTTKVGEIDILARKRNIIVVVEVKTKSGDDFGKGFEMVNYFKQKKLLLLAKALQADYPDKTIRIDVISVDLNTSPPHLDHYENAVLDE